MSSRWPDKYIIGLTGNIATGKSAILQMAADQNALTIDADKLVHQILDGDRFVQESIAIQLGPGTQLPDGRIDRGAVGNIVFSNPEALDKLEKILHPVVRRQIIEIVTNSETQIVFIEAIKLLEGSLKEECQEIWVTRCPQEVQIQRLVKFREMDREMAIVRVNAQSPQIHKIAVADVVIDTSGTLAETSAYFKLAWLGLLRRVKREFDKESIEPKSSEEMSVDQAAMHSSDKKDLWQPENSSPVAIQGDFETVPRYPGIVVRRAQLFDAEQVTDLIRRATSGSVKMNQSDYVSALSDRGYLIAQQDEQTRGVIGWSAENLVAIIDELFIDPIALTKYIGGAMLAEIVKTASDLICEVIISFPKLKDSVAVHELYTEWGFQYVDARTFPREWQTKVSEDGSRTDVVMLKLLRDTRQTKLRYMNRRQAFHGA